MSEDLKLAHVRAQADQLGVKYHHKAGVEKIQAAIDAHLVGQQEELNTPNTVEVADDLPKMEEVKPMTREEFVREQRRENRAKAGRLVRCVIQCMDPNKREWPGEIISVGSAKLGTFKKYIPFNSEPYHIPKIIFDMLSEKKCSVFYNAIGDKGHKTRKSRLINAYNIQVLDPLTPEELKELARKQAIRQGKEG